MRVPTARLPAGRSPWQRLFTLALLTAPCSWAAATTVVMKNGMQFEGRVSEIRSLNENPLNAAAGANDAPKSIVVIDDDLRRTFVFQIQVASYGESPALSRERFVIQQRAADAGLRIGNVGRILGVTPFDEFGRRTFSMQDERGPIHVVQGMTLITPDYVKIEGLLTQQPYIWDSRVATSAIDPVALNRVLHKQIDNQDADARLRIVHFYLQSQRYAEAMVELQRVIADFPKLAELDKQLSRIHQLLAQDALSEIDLRRGAGQHRRAQALLSHFPEKGTAGEILLRVRDVLGEYEKQQATFEQAMQTLDQQIVALKDEAAQKTAAAAAAEMRRDLFFGTLPRLASYLRFSDDNGVSEDRKVALAVSGWLAGSGNAIDNLSVATSMWDVRNLVRDYLRAERIHEREAVLDQIRGEEGGTPAHVANLLAHMKPPLDPPAPPAAPPDYTAAPATDADTMPAASTIPGLFTLTVPGIAEQSQFTYHIQLPPEYDPYTRYPCLVTLSGGGQDELQQITWWAGDYSDKAQMRTDQASRYGYIVLAPVWRQPEQQQYEFSVREHAAVLFTLRDACRRFAIDTDRVFLSGHALGGDAAWDIGAAHPDLWAGVIPIVANGGKYILHYTENARAVPWYFVGGEKDFGWIHRNGVEFDRYLTSPRFDCTVVQFQGRGHEHFHDEIQRLFTWMQLASHRRQPFPREINVESMRPWDNYFWWLEIDDIGPRSIVLPVEWPKKGVRALATEGAVLATHRVSAAIRSGKATIWLSPEMVNFDEKVEIAVNGKKLRAEIKPDVGVLLEDVRTRGDRQHPFWARVDWPERS